MGVDCMLCNNQKTFTPDHLHFHPASMLENIAISVSDPTAVNLNSSDCEINDRCVTTMNQSTSSQSNLLTRSPTVDWTQECNTNDLIRRECTVAQLFGLFVNTSIHASKFHESGSPSNQRLVDIVDILSNDSESQFYVNSYTESDSLTTCDHCVKCSNFPCICQEAPWKYLDGLTKLGTCDNICDRGSASISLADYLNNTGDTTPRLEQVQRKPIKFPIMYSMNPTTSFEILLRQNQIGSCVDGNSKQNGIDDHEHASSTVRGCSKINGLSQTENYLLKRRTFLLDRLVERYSELLHLMNEELEITGHAPEQYLEYVHAYHDAQETAKKARLFSQSEDGTETNFNDSLSKQTSSSEPLRSTGLYGSRLQETGFLLSPQIVRKAKHQLSPETDNFLRGSFLSLCSDGRSGFYRTHASIGHSLSKKFRIGSRGRSKVSDTEGTDKLPPPHKGFWLNKRKSMKQVDNVKACDQSIASNLLDLGTSISSPSIHDLCVQNNPLPNNPSDMDECTSSLMDNISSTGSTEDRIQENLRYKNRQEAFSWIEVELMAVKNILDANKKCSMNPRLKKSSRKIYLAAIQKNLWMIEQLECQKKLLLASPNITDMELSSVDSYPDSISNDLSKLSTSETQHSKDRTLCKQGVFLDQIDENPRMDTNIHYQSKFHSLIPDLVNSSGMPQSLYNAASKTPKLWRTNRSKTFAANDVRHRFIANPKLASVSVTMEVPRNVPFPKMEQNNAIDSGWRPIESQLKQAPSESTPYLTLVSHTVPQDMNMPRSRNVSIAQIGSDQKDGDLSPITITVSSDSSRTNSRICDIETTCAENLVNNGQLKSTSIEQISNATACFEFARSCSRYQRTISLPVSCSLPVMNDLIDEYDTKTNSKSSDSLYQPTASNYWKASAHTTLKDNQPSTDTQNNQRSIILPIKSLPGQRIHPNTPVTDMPIHAINSPNTHYSLRMQHKQPTIIYIERRPSSLTQLPDEQNSPLKPKTSTYACCTKNGEQVISRISDGATFTTELHEISSPAPHFPATYVQHQRDLRCTRNTDLHS